MEIVSSRAHCSKLNRPSAYLFGRFKFVCCCLFVSAVRRRERLAQGEREMRRILFRLWLVATVLWACLIFFALYDDKRPDANVIAAQAAFVPPAIIFVIGVMLVWAFRGFSRQK
jgi:hypothetical protein